LIALLALPTVLALAPASHGEPRDDGASRTDDATDEATGDKPTVYFGKLAVKGSLSTRIILRILKRRTSALLRCYHKGLKRKPNLRGRMAVKFIISSTELVQHASVAASTLGDKRIERCVLRTIEKTRFPSCGGGGIVIVIVPIAFTIK
jgi:hypothetical protein